MTNIRGIQNVIDVSKDNVVSKVIFTSSDVINSRMSVKYLNLWAKDLSQQPIIFPVPKQFSPL